LINILKAGIKIIETRVKLETRLQWWDFIIKKEQQMQVKIRQ